MKIKKIYDISRKVSEKTTVWPGDPMTSFRRVSFVGNGEPATLHRVKMGLHAGTHLDAPMHFIEGGDSIYEADLTKYIGTAKVFEMNVTESISFEDILHLDIVSGDIVLFKTKNSDVPDDEPFRENYVYLTSGAAQLLADRQVKTVGTDYLSVEHYFSEAHKTHNILLGNNIGVIENLKLKDVPAGQYFLSSLPLKLEGVEASPVRAVLIEFS